MLLFGYSQMFINRTMSFLARWSCFLSERIWNYPGRIVGVLWDYSGLTGR